MGYQMYISCASEPDHQVAPQAQAISKAYNRTLITRSHMSWHSSQVLPVSYYTLTCHDLSTSNPIRVNQISLLNKRCRARDLLAHNVALDEVREPDFDLVADVLFSGDGEDLCEESR